MSTAIASANLRKTCGAFGASRPQRWWNEGDARGPTPREPRPKRTSRRRGVRRRRTYARVLAAVLEENHLPRVVEAKVSGAVDDDADDGDGVAAVEAPDALLGSNLPHDVGEAARELLDLAHVRREAPAATKSLQESRSRGPTSFSGGISTSRPRPRRATSAEYPRRDRDRVATSTEYPRRGGVTGPPWNIHVAAAASPRPVRTRPARV